MNPNEPTPAETPVSDQASPEPGNEAIVPQGPDSPKLSALEVRVLGCLLEKERLTPDNYPLSLNSLVNACNQTTNREPVVFYSEKLVGHGLDLLRQKKLAREVREAGSRVQKYKHTLLEEYDLSSGEVALLCVLMLRGPQTVGELRTRTERLHSFVDLTEVETVLRGLTEGTQPLAGILPAGPGQKEKRYYQLFSGEPAATPTAAEPGEKRSAQVLVDETTLTSLRGEVESLRGELASLREEFAQFRRQFE